jgi:hypothetical protein
MDASSPGLNCSHPYAEAATTRDQPDPWLGFLPGVVGRGVHPQINEVTAPVLLVEPASIYGKG